MRKIYAGFITLVFIINTIFTGTFGTVALAADTNLINFEWEKQRTLDNKLNIIERGLNYDDVFLWWDFGINEGLSFDSGEYKLSYNLQDNKRIDFTVTKRGAAADVLYKVWDYSKNDYVPIADTIYQVYKDSSGGYVLPNQTTFPPISEDYKVVYGGDGQPEEVKFSIIPNTGFSLKFDNRTIKFKWVTGTGNDVFYFVTDGASQGNIYDFNLDLNISGGVQVEKSLQVFTGINSTTFKSTPYANNRKDELDHTQRPFADEDPGTDPEIVMEFDIPKKWDEEAHKFVYIDETNAGEDDKTTVIMDLGNASDMKKIQVQIADIYASDINSTTTISTASGAEVKSERKDNKIYVNITKLEAGTIYNPVEISLYKPNNSDFLSSVTEIEHGKVYTYPVFSVISMASDEFYLKIEPYKGYKGFYVINSGATSATMSKWAEYEDKTGGTKPIYVPINVNAINNQTQFFQVEFRFTPPDASPGSSQVTLKSQILKYKPAQEDIVVGTPRNLEVVDLSIVPALNDNTKQELVMTLKWDVSYVEILKNIINKNNGVLDLYYTFKKGDIPYDDNEEEFAKIKMHMTMSGDDINIEFSDEEGKLEESKYTIQEEMVGDTKYNMVKATVKFRLPVASKELASEQFLYPNIYFINVKGEYLDGTTNIETSASLPVDITLNDMVDVDVPQPQNIKVINDEDNKIGNTKFSLKWDNLDGNKADTSMYKYRMEMLDPRGLELSDKSIRFNAYITQDKAILDSFMSYDDKRDTLPTDLKDKLKVYNHNDQLGTDAIQASTSTTTDGVVIRDWLRTNGIVKIENIMQKYNVDYQQLDFKGLDKNQEYYVILETTVVPYNAEKDTHLTDEMDTSPYSHMISVTTLNDNETPQPEENMPSAPQNFDKKDITLNSVTLIWDKVKEILEPNSKDTLEYQFVRITGQQMTDEDIKSRDHFNSTWQRLPSTVEKVGWRTSADKIYEYNAPDFSTMPSEDLKFNYNISDYTINSLIDKTVMPNELYFYYIRTVRVVDGTDKSYSVWVPLTVTTTPVEGPENLKIEYNETYDKNSEAVISFDTPPLNIANLGNGLEIQYQLKEDNNDWQSHVTMDSSTLLKSYTTKPDGNLHFKYKIKGLKSGVMYSIRVRIFDTKLNEGSLYSNIAQVRTDTEQESIDKEHEKEDWIDRYKELLEDLSKEPYWYLRDNVSNTEVLYRPNNFDGILAQSTEGSIDLAIGIGGYRKTYYLPSKMVNAAFDANKGFRVRWNEMDVVFSPKSIDPDSNDAILKLRDRMKERDIKDYYVKLVIDFNDSPYTIDGNESISPSVDITVEAVETEEDLSEWDTDMFNLLIKLMEKSKTLKDLAEDIMDELEDDSKNEEIMQVIKDAVADVKDDFLDDLDDELKDIIDKSYETETLNNSIIIAYPVDQSASAAGYRQTGGAWNLMQTSNYMNKLAMYTNSTGLYVFAGRIINIPGITEVDNGTPITKIIAKYGLDDYLGKDSALNLKTPLTKNMAIGSVARLAGASRTADPMTFLQSKGVKVTGRGSDQNVSIQEAIYLTMTAYEIRTNTKVETIKIRNYSLTANLQGLQPNYKTSVQAAYELGIFTNKNVNPNGGITVEDFLQMLVNLSNKANL